MHADGLQPGNEQECASMVRMENKILSTEFRGEAERFRQCQALWHGSEIASGWGRSQICLGTTYLIRERTAHF